MIGDFGLSTDASNSSAHQHEVPFLDSSRLDGSAPTLPTQLALPRSDNESSRCFFSFQVGTTTYAAPEQLSGPFYNKSADMYPLGIILVELLCPFRGDFENYQIVLILDLQRTCDAPALAARQLQRPKLKT